MISTSRLHCEQFSVADYYICHWISSAFVTVLYAGEKNQKEEQKGERDESLLGVLTKSPSSHQLGIRLCYIRQRQLFCWSLSGFRMLLRNKYGLFILGIFVYSFTVMAL
jgi:hypothetical protein